MASIVQRGISMLEPPKALLSLEGEFCPGRINRSVVHARAAAVPNQHHRTPKRLVLSFAQIDRNEEFFAI